MIVARKISRIFSSGGVELTVFRELDIDIADGEFVAVMGESGAGKSTLLHLLGLLDKPSEGLIYFNGLLTENFSEQERDSIRLNKIGFLLQQHHLLSDFTSLENVAIPSLAQGTNLKLAKNEALGILNDFGLGDRANSFPAQLSGGEMQRTALARALINKPELLIADEPAGNLDVKNSRKLMEYLQIQRKKSNLTVILATHDPEIASYADRILSFSNGKLSV